MSIQSYAWPLRTFPKIALAGHLPMGQNSHGVHYSSKTVALHYHNYRAKMTLGRRTILISVGDITLSPPGVISTYELPENGYHWCIHFHPERTRCGPNAHLFVYLRSRPQFALVLERMQQIADWQRRSIQAGARSATLKAAASAALQEILLFLGSEPEFPQREIAGKATLAIKQTLDKINDCIGKPFSVAHVAFEVGMSQNYLSRLFRKQYGVTIQHYTLMRRMEVAKHLLLTTNKRVKEIGVIVGLTDAQYFNKVFRRMSGVSPNGFRRIGSR